MNTSTTPRRWAVAVAAFCLLLTAGYRANGQCGDFVTAPLPANQPVPINLFVNSGGTVTLDAAVMSVFGFSINGGCVYELSNVANFSGGLTNLPVNFTCADITASPITRYVRVNGASGPSANSRTLIITITDNIKPNITCPASPVVNAGAGLCSATLAGLAPTATDNCAVTTQTWSASGATTAASPNTGINSASGTNFNVGLTTVTYVASDASNNTRTCTFTVQVNDNQAPSITCPANQVLNTDPGVCSKTLAALPNPVAVSDNCGSTTITWMAPGAIPASGAGLASSVEFPEGVTNVTYTVTDGASLSANCAFNVTVNDNQNPVINGVPANQSNIGTSTGGATPLDLCDGSFTWNHPTITDNCAGPNTLQMAISGATTVALAAVTQGASITQLFNLGTSTVTYTATDINGLTSSATFTVIVKDNVAPVVTPNPTGQNFNFPVLANNCFREITFTRPSMGSVADCGPVTLTETVVSGPDLDVLIAEAPFPPMGGGTIDVNFPAGTTVIRYRWTDNAMNSIFVDYTFTVDENQPPVAQCVNPMNPIPLSLDPVLGVALLDAALVNNGSYDNCGIKSITVSPSLFDCNSLLPLTPMVTLTVTDNSNLTSTCTATVAIVDNTPPVVTCPANITVPADPMLGCNATVFDLFFNEASPVNGPKQYFDNSIDNCGIEFEYKLNAAPFVSVTPVAGQVNLSNVQFSTGSNNMTVRVKDDSGNSFSCSFNVNVTDVQGPTFSGGTYANGATANVNTVANGCFAQLGWVWPTATDVCNPPVSTLFQSHQPNAIFPLGTTTVTWLAKDAIGNISTYSFQVVVTDNQDPVAKCKNATVQLNAMGTASLPASAIDNGSTDNCSFTLSPATFNFSCTPLGANIVTLTATDFGGRTSTCTATVTVQDLIAPTVSCQAGTLTVNLTGTSATILPNQIFATSTDNCSKTDSIKLDAGGAYMTSITVNCSDIGLHTVFHKATDPAGNVTSTCSRQVQVVDAGIPTITAPMPVTANCDAYYAQIQANGFFNSGTPTASDNCATPTITYTDAPLSTTCANGFTFVRTWKASDGVNMATATQVITVQDITKPVLTLSSPVVVNSTQGPGGMPACSAPVNLAVQNSQIADNCTADLNMTYSYYIDYPAPPNNYGFTDVGSAMTPVNGNPGVINFPIGISTVTYIARDECGNTTAQTITVEVKDAIAPAFNYPKCGEQVVLPNTSGACSNLYSWVRPWSLVPNVTDCQNFAVTETINNPTVQQSINLSNPFNYSGFPFQVFATAQFPVGVTTVTYTATDASNNVSICSFTVEVEDTQVPQLTCPGDQILLATCPTAQVPDYRNLVLVSDNCPGNVVLTQTFAPTTTLGSIFAPNPPAAGNTFPITIQGQDAYNTTSCTFNVTLQDGQAPIPTIAVLPMLIDSCGGIVIEAPTASDPCNPNAPVIFGTPSTPVGIFIPGTPPKYNLMPGNYVITWLYDDGNGNVTTQPQNITVLEDIFPPKALCKPTFTVALNSQGLSTVTIPQMDNGSNDPNECGPITLSLINPILDCSDLGDAVVSLVATDQEGNSDTCSVIVNVVDEIAPALEPAPNDTTIQACQPIPDAAILTGSDNCDQEVEVSFEEVSTQTASGYGLYNYTITRTWTGVDNFGNEVTEVQVITVVDTEDPELLADTPDTLVIQTAPDDLFCNALLEFNLADYVTDCETGDDIFITSNGGIGSGSDITGFYGVGTHSISFVVSDSSFNQTNHLLTLIVEDATPPNAICINGVSASLQPSGTVTVIDFQFNNLSFDNCFGFAIDIDVQRLDESPLQAPSDILTYDCSDADGVTQHPVKLYVYDGFGNVSTCNTYIVIQDNVAPEITLCPPSKTLLCTDDLSPNLHQFAQATDNCASPGNPVITYEDFDVNPDSNATHCYQVDRVWTVTDQANNITTCVQSFFIIDTVAPVLSAYNPDITVSCETGVPSPLSISATDNCSLNIPVDLQEDTINVAQGPCGNYSYTIVRTRTAVDECGNVTVHVRNITVVDTTAPSFPGLPDTLKIYSANNPPNSNCTVPVNYVAAPFDCADTSEMLITNDAPFGDSILSISGNYPVGSYLIYFSAIDACGNVGVDSMILEVIDNSIPTAICNNNVVISLGSNGSATIQADDIDLGSVDNCALDTMYLDVSTFDCDDLGLNPVTLSVVDIYGNLNTCTVNVEVTLGVGSGLTIDVQGNDESFFGAEDGEATVTATGGSGNFTYEWSNDETTTTISGLTPGTYYVTVYDQSSGCQQVDSVVIVAGAKIKITVGNEGGAQGETVSVPVTVESFTNVAGFTFTVNVVDPAVGTVVGVSGIDANLSSLQANLLPGNNVGVLWTDLNPLTLPDGTVLFYVDVQLGTAPLGAISPVDITGTPVVLNFTVEGANGSVDVIVDQMNGSVEITELVNTDVTLAGDIKTWANPENPNSVEKPVANVTVTLSGTVSDTEITTAAGTYDFSVPLNANTITSCEKVTVGPPFNAGVTAGDLLRIVNHIFGDTFPSPYQWIAADVNNTKTVTLADYLLIQRLALGTDQHIMNSPDWKFVPKSYMFPSNSTMPFGPLTLPYPQTIEHNPADQNFLDDDFVAVRMGDVNGNTPVNLTNDNADDRTGETFKFRINDRAFHAGELVTIPFKASDFTNRHAYQMTINFDPSVFELADYQGGALELTDENFGTAHLANGHLTTLWVSREALSINDDEVLFTVTFRALRNSTSLSKVLHAGSEITRAEAYNADGSTMKVDFEFVQPQNGLNEADFALYQNQPNPFRQGTVIGFRLPESGRASLRVFNAAGQLVKLVVGNFEQGYNEVRFEKGDFGTPGVYWYELETPTNSDRKKMILID